MTNTNFVSNSLKEKGLYPKSENKQFGLNISLTSNKELIIFRDSFASSLVPLIIEDYSKITMVDIRYMSTDRAMKYIENDGADILFIYSATVINNSSILK